MVEEGKSGQNDLDNMITKNFGALSAVSVEELVNLKLKTRKVKGGAKKTGTKNKVVMSQILTVVPKVSSECTPRNAGQPGTCT
jgi:hypothetical protein